MSNFVDEFNTSRELLCLFIYSPSEHAGSGCYEDFVPIKHWLDRAMVKYGGSHLDIEVEEVKALLKILPVFAFLIVYCICYYQVRVSIFY